MRYLDEYRSPKPDECRGINSALLYKIMFTDTPL